MIIFLVIGVGLCLIAAMFALLVAINAFLKAWNCAVAGIDGAGPYTITSTVALTVSGLLMLAAYRACT